jgi:hypothetical protein
MKQIVIAVAKSTIILFPQTQYNTKETGREGCLLGCAMARIRTPTRKML